MRAPNLLALTGLTGLLLLGACGTSTAPGPIPLPGPNQPTTPEDTVPDTVVPAPEAAPSRFTMTARRGEVGGGEGESALLDVEEDFDVEPWTVSRTERELRVQLSDYLEGLELKLVVGLRSSCQLPGSVTLASSDCALDIFELTVPCSKDDYLDCTYLPDMDDPFTIDVQSFTADRVTGEMRGKLYDDGYYYLEVIRASFDLAIR